MNRQVWHDDKICHIYQQYQEVNVVLMQLNQMEIPGKNRGLERKSKSMKRNVKY
jgi:hypothetical protein